MEMKQKIFVTIGTAAVAAVAIFGGVALYNGAMSAQTGGVQVSSAATHTSTSVGSNTTYKDGTYTKTVSYYVPHGGSNSITVTLTVSGGAITNLSTNDTYTDSESQRYVSSFENGVSSDANGQLLSSYSPSRIGGASLTTEAFMRALSGVRNDAAA